MEKVLRDERIIYVGVPNCQSKALSRQTPLILVRFPSLFMQRYDSGKRDNCRESAP
jgi:hypothetical protein